MNSQLFKENKNLLPAIILGASLIISAFIYAWGNRYEVHWPVVVDKWTNTYHAVESK